MATKLDLPSSNTEVDEIDMDTLKTVPADLSKLVNVVDTCNVVDVVKKNVYDKQLLRLTPLTLADFFEKLNITLINHV